MTTTERRHERDGLAVVERSDGEGPLIVLVHGAMDRATSFGRVARRLADHSLLRYDRRGYGRSEPGASVPLDRHVDDLLSLVDGRPAVVLGHSFGGTVALAAASRTANSLVGLVVYESPVAAVGPIDPFPRRSDEDPADLAERFMRVMVGESVWSRLPERTRADRRAEGPALVADLESAVDGGALVDPASITVPVVVGVGERSRPAAQDRARALADALAAATSVTVPGAGHGVHLTHPTATADLVLGALRALDALGLRGDAEEPGDPISSG